MIDFEKIRSSFPILDVKVNENKLVYFDNAATTQTPTQVTNSIRAVSYTHLTLPTRTRV